MPCYEIDGIRPVVHPTAYVHPDAVLIGDVFVGAGCYVAPLASLRGDFGRIVLEEGSNVQDCCVLHSFPGIDTVVEVNGHVGHAAVLHACRVGRNALIGMNAVVMDEAEIGANSILAALAFVKAGERIPEGVLAVGQPARVVRALTGDEIAWKRQGTQVYQRLALEARERMAPAVPLCAPEPGRRRAEAPAHDPLILDRLRFSGRP